MTNTTPPSRGARQRALASGGRDMRRRACDNLFAVVKLGFFSSKGGPSVYWPRFLALSRWAALRTPPSSSRCSVGEAAIKLSDISRTCCCQISHPSAPSLLGPLTLHVACLAIRFARPPPGVAAVLLFSQKRFLSERCTLKCCLRSTR